MIMFAIVNFVNNRNITILLIYQRSRYIEIFTDTFGQHTSIFFQIYRLMSTLMSFRIYLMMLFLKALLTKDSTEGLRRSTLKRSKLNCWKISGWILINGYGFKLHLVIGINGTAWKWEWYSSCRWKILKIGDKIPKNYSKISSMTKLVIKKYDMAWKSSARHWLNPYLIYWK